MRDSTDIPSRAETRGPTSLRPGKRGGTRIVSWTTSCLRAELELLVEESEHRETMTGGTSSRCEGGNLDQSTKGTVPPRSGSGRVVCRTPGTPSGASGPASSKVRRRGRGRRPRDSGPRAGVSGGAATRGARRMTSPCLCVFTSLPVLPGSPNSPGRLTPTVPPGPGALTRQRPRVVPTGILTHPGTVLCPTLGMEVTRVYLIFQVHS